MKVAYVYYLLLEGQLGIETKIRQQLPALEAIGWDDLDIIVVNPTSSRREGRIRYVKLPGFFVAGRYIEHAFRRYRMIDRVVDLTGYDAVILRYPLADGSGQSFVEKHRVITEHHANEAAEMRSRLPQAGLPERMIRRLLLAMEDRYAPVILGNCRGIIGVTDEIRAYECGRAAGAAARTVPSRTIANGIHVDGVTHSGFRRFDGRQLNLVVVATNYRPWHGLERIVESINGYKGSVDVRLQVIGDMLPHQLNLDERKLRSVDFLGTRSGEELDALMKDANLAISTLSLYRKQMNEASSLKTREYTARGLPFILAYHDPDLADIDTDKAFCLNFPNDDSPIDMSHIIDFAADVSRRRPEIMDTMRAYALNSMDWRVKLQAYRQFLRETSHIDQGVFVRT